MFPNILAYGVKTPSLSYLLRLQRAKRVELLENRRSRTEGLDETFKRG